MSDQTDILVYLFFGQIVPDSNQYFDIWDFLRLL